MIAGPVYVLAASRWAAEGVAAALRDAGAAVRLIDRWPPQAESPAPDISHTVLVWISQAGLPTPPALPRGLAVLVLGGQPPPFEPDRATGWLQPDAGAEHLLAAVAALQLGLSVRQAGGRAGTNPWPASGALAEPPTEPLTAREAEVFELLAEGASNRDIGQALGISSHTAKFHVAQILDKTGAATRAEAVRLGLRLGLIGL